MVGGQAMATNCGTYPDKVIALPYGGWSDCALKEFGEKPIWKGLAKGTAQVMRFTFTEGHGSFFRVVTITQSKDGVATLKVDGDSRSGIRRRPWQRMTVLRKTLSPADMAKLDELGLQTGVWEFDLGSWDGDELYMHCQTLDIERANAAGYRYSSVNIGCNQPTKLMPLITEIAGLAGLKTGGNGMLYY